MSEHTEKQLEILELQLEIALRRQAIEHTKAEAATEVKDVEFYRANIERLTQRVAHLKAERRAVNSQIATYRQIIGHIEAAQKGAHAHRR
jgi:chromosome segregation ATPase